MDLEQRRLDLHEILVDALGSGNVYFQPPASLKMVYPCIRYNRATADAKFANNGLYNVGGDGSYPTGNRGLIDRTGQPDDMGKFRVPSLRNLAFTFPYMHDGSISTLDEVVEHYARGGRVIVTGPNAGDGRLSPRKDPRIRAHTLTTQDKGDLVAFLRSLSDSALVTAPRFANPGPTR